MAFWEGPFTGASAFYHENSVGWRYTNRTVDTVMTWLIALECIWECGGPHMSVHMGYVQGVAILRKGLGRKGLVAKLSHIDVYPLAFY